MRTYLDCYPCFIRQALEAARWIGADEAAQKLLLDRVLKLLGKVELSSTPPQIGDRVHRLVRESLGDGDPYRSFKQDATREALDLYPRMEALAAEAADPLEAAVRLSIAGNIIDAGFSHRYDLWGTVERVMSQPFAVEHLAALRGALAGARSALYLADNAGETVFDRPLIQRLGLPVIYAVKGGPVLNDATMEDARAAGLEAGVRLLSTGSDAPGTILERCSQEFREVYGRSELVIAKGQANYETLSEEGPRVFFLLQAKCPIVARDLEVEVGGIVLRQGGRE